jgi:uncharacterized protein
VGKTWALHAAAALAGLSAGATFLFGALDLATASRPAAAGTIHNPVSVDVGIMITAIVAAAVGSKPLRDLLARLIPIDSESPVHALALALAVILLGTQLSSLLLTDVLAAGGSGAPLTLVDLLAQELPFAILAAAGVGFLMRRDLGATGARLGLVVPEWWQIALALAAAGAFFAFGQAVDALGQWLTPQTAQRVQSTSQHIFGNLAGGLGIIALALGPGFCEEVLFRGALQPRFGLVATAVLFASVHSEYGFSFDLLAIFVIAIGLGLLRKTCNTTTSSLCHVTYNLAAGVGITGSVIGWAVALEIALIAVAAYGLYRRRAGQQAAARLDSSV